MHDLEPMPRKQLELAEWGGWFLAKATGVFLGCSARRIDKQKVKGWRDPH